MGPCLVTKEEIPDPYPLRLQLRVNGELRQDGMTSDMISKIPALISSASEANTLLPGDVIATGTCSGVGLYTGKYLKDGDVVEAEVERIGVLRNRIRAQHWRLDFSTNPQTLTPNKSPVMDGMPKLRRARL